VIEFDPTANVEVLYVALPPLTVPVPSVVLPFLNVTVPVAVEIERAAVNVTELPGFCTDCLLPGLTGVYRPFSGMLAEVIEAKGRRFIIRSL
jgi:hypothetical protein